MSSDVIERFFTKVQIRRNACWLWKAAKDHQGYGYFRMGEQMAMAHRVAYELLKGEIPDGFQIDHLCKNTSCVKPSHLEAVTPKVNVHRSNSLAAKRARMTHCHKGHPFNEENTYYDGVKRYCRACGAERARRRRRQRKES